MCFWHMQWCQFGFELCDIYDTLWWHFVLCLKVELMRVFLYTDSGVELDASFNCFDGLIIKKYGLIIK